MFREKSCVRWLIGEDHNTIFYQSVMKARRAQASLSSLNIQDNLTNDAGLIKEHVINVYQGLFGDTTKGSHVDVSHVIRSLVTFEENSLLTKVSDGAKIRSIVLEMDGSKVFQSRWFYQ